MSRTHEILKQVKSAIRNPYAWPGGYPVYTILADGELLCCECARENFRLIVDSTRHNFHDGWQAAGADILWEYDTACGNCGKAIESAYGNPDDDGEEE